MTERSRGHVEELDGRQVRFLPGKASFGREGSGSFGIPGFATYFIPGVATPVGHPISLVVQRFCRFSVEMDG